MAERAPSPIPMPARVLTLDQAYERAYRQLRAFCRGLYERDDAIGGAAAVTVNQVAYQLTKDLIDCGIGGTLAFQLARPPGAE